MKTKKSKLKQEVAKLNKIVSIKSNNSQRYSTHQKPQILIVLKVISVNILRNIQLFLRVQNLPLKK